MRQNKLRFLLLFGVFATQVGATGEQQDITKIQPYQIPRFNGKTDDFQHISPIKKSKPIDGDEVFRMIVNCFPERSRWDGWKIKAQGGLRYSEKNTISVLDESGLARHYVGIVAEMPLFAPDETYRQQEQERGRRKDIAGNIAELLKSMADRDRALRKIGIAESVEARSQLRVQRGIAPAEEQIGYLKDVANAVGDLDAANAAIAGARITLSGQCRAGAAEQVNDYLTRITK